MRLLRLLFSAGFLMGLVATGHAQSPWTMGINFTYDHALSDFGNNIHSSPVGMSFMGMYRIPNSKFSVGGDLGIAMFAHKKYELSLEERGYSGATVTVDEEDCYLNYNAVLRYTLVEDGLFTPYAEARAGGISFFNTKIYDRPEGPGAPKKIDDEFDFLGTTWQTGFGGGIMLDLSQALPMWIDAPIMIDFAATYYNSNRTNYQRVSDEGGLRTTTDDNRFRSRASRVAYRLGVVIPL